MEEIKLRLQSKVDRLKKVHGIKKNDIAEYCGMSRQALHKAIHHGKHRGNLMRLEAVLDILIKKYSR